MELVLWIYMIDFLASLQALTVVVIMLGLLVIIAGSVIYTVNIGEGNVDLIPPIVMRSMRAALLSTILAVIVTVVIPSKDSMYLMAGAYAGTTIMNSEAMNEVPEILTKTLSIINRELDKKVGE